MELFLRCGAVSAASAGLAAVIGLSFVGQASSQDSAPPAGFFLGSYVVVGQHPDGGSVYGGSASIEAGVGEVMILERRIDGETIRETLRVSSLQPLADASVLNVHDDGGVIVASCLWASDLDNYPRLTCLRAPRGGRHDQLGYEAMFPAH
ncbi:MAG: hypothetical protein ACFCVH_05665 [Alphaproteobacteria bacterium]